MHKIKSIFSIINLLGINAFFRFANKSKDLCLMYHGIVPDDYPIQSWLLVKESQFRKQLEYLTKHWEVIHIDAYIARDFHTAKPKAIITFDDGYQNNYSVAYPILKKLKLPATIYVVTDFIDTNELFWFDKVIYSIQKNNLSFLDLTFLPHDNLGARATFHPSGTQRWSTIERLLTNIKSLGATKAEETAKRIFEFVTPETHYTNYLTPLKTQQILEMSRSGFIEIGAHTAHHEILTDLTCSQAEQTITRSMAAIKNIIGKSPSHFCYPNGNYSKPILDLMQRYNFSSAMTVQNSFITPENYKKYELPRLPVSAFDSIHSFKGEICGLKEFLKQFTLPRQKQ